MSWYSTYEEAEEACKWKEKEYGYRFYVLPEETVISKYPDGVGMKEATIYWAQRKIPTEKILPENLST